MYRYAQKNSGYDTKYAGGILESGGRRTWDPSALYSISKFKVLCFASKILIFIFVAR